MDDCLVSQCPAPESDHAYDGEGVDGYAVCSRCGQIENAKAATGRCPVKALDAAEAKATRLAGDISKALCALGRIPPPMCIEVDEALRILGGALAPSPPAEVPPVGDELAEAFTCLASLCESNKGVIVGAAKGAPSFWESIGHWIRRGRAALPTSEKGADHAHGD